MGFAAGASDHTPLFLRGVSDSFVNCQVVVFSAHVAFVAATQCCPCSSEATTDRPSSMDERSSGNLYFPKWAEFGRPRFAHAHRAPIDSPPQGRPGLALREISVPGPTANHCCNCVVTVFLVHQAGEMNTDICKSVMCPRISKILTGCPPEVPATVPDPGVRG